MIELAAYYFPQYHPDPRNDRRHRPGWTEWDLLRGATPRFPGHAQPIRPAWGEFDESDPTWAARKIDLAADHGLSTFIYDWYWYEDGPFLDAALERGFLGAPNRARMKFALMWANHDWLDLFPARHPTERRLIAPGAVSRAGFDRMAAHIVDRLFSQPNHLRVDGAPYFSIYELHTFVAGLGGLDAAVAALDAFRARARAAGHPGIHLNVVEWGLRAVPGSPADVLRRIGADSVDSYCWIHDIQPANDEFPRADWSRIAARMPDVWEAHAAACGVPYHPNISVGWDSSPRTDASIPFAAHGYPWTAVWQGCTPERLRDILASARDVAARLPAGRQLVTVNAWNEWTEGSYLLPDATSGLARLEAIRAVFPR